MRIFSGVTPGKPPFSIKSVTFLLRSFVPTLRVCFYFVYSQLFNMAVIITFLVHRLYLLVRDEARIFGLGGLISAEV